MVLPDPEPSGGTGSTGSTGTPGGSTGVVPINNNGSSTPVPPPPPKKKSNLALVIGIVVGVLGLLAVIGFLVYYIMK